MLCSLKDEIAALRREVCQLRVVNVVNASSNNNNARVKQDISDIKLILQNSGAQNKVLKKLDRSQDEASYTETAGNGSSHDWAGKTRYNERQPQETKIGATATRKELSNSMPIQRNDISNTQSVRQRYPAQSNHQLEHSVQPTVQHNQNMEWSDRKSES